MERKRLTLAELRALNIQSVRFHKRLPSDLKQKVALIQHTFRTVIPISPKQWEDDLCHDLNPANEVQLWLQMGLAYELYFARRQETLAEGHQVLTVLLACVTAGDLFAVYSSLQDTGMYVAIISEVCACYWMERDKGVPIE